MMDSVFKTRSTYRIQAKHTTPCQSKSINNCFIPMLGNLPNKNLNSKKPTPVPPHVSRGHLVVHLVTA